MKLADILYWLLVVFVTYVIFELVRKIWGGSLEFEELVIALLVTIIGYLGALHKKIIDLHKDMGDIRSRLSEHLGWHDGRKEKRR